MKIDYWQNMEEGQVYHVYNRCISDRELFYTDDNFKYFLTKFAQYFDNYLDVYAYCLIPNHFHFLVKVKPVSKEIIGFIKNENTKSAKKYLSNEIPYFEFLENQFKRFLGGYAQAMNKQLGKRGALFEKRFKRVKVKNKTRFLEMIFYIHHNPIHHGIFEDYDIWKFSSYNAYVSEKPTKLKKEIVVKLFDNKIENFVKSHEAYKKERFKQLLDDLDMLV